MTFSILFSLKNSYSGGNTCHLCLNFVKMTVNVIDNIMSWKICANADSNELCKASMGNLTKIESL